MTGQEYLNHLTIILDKAEFARQRAVRTITLIERLRNHAGDIESLFPDTEVLETATMPDAAEYAEIDGSLDNIEGYLEA